MRGRVHAISTLKGLVADLRVDNDDAKSLMNDFKDQICQKFGLKCKSGIVWEVRRDEFLKVVLNQSAM